MYIDWNGREQEDLEADNMQRDAREEQLRWQGILGTFIGSVKNYDEENNTCYAAYLNASTDTFSHDLKALAELLRNAVESASSEEEEYDPLLGLEI